MATLSSTADRSWWMFTLPALLNTDSRLLFSLFVAAVVSFALISWALSVDGAAWCNGRARRGRVPIPVTSGLPVFGSLFSLASFLPHRVLANLSISLSAKSLMAFSIGATPAVVTSDPHVASEILSHPLLADRPTSRSHRELMFARSMGFAPDGPYWRQLRRIATTHLFAHRRVASHEPGRQSDCSDMVFAISSEQRRSGAVHLRAHLQNAALNNIMGSVFGRRYDVLSSTNPEAEDLKEMVREGFDLLGQFNWSDHLPWLAYFYDPADVRRRCAVLVPRVKKLVSSIIAEHRDELSSNGGNKRDNADFVDVLLSLDGKEKLQEDDMIAVLWEMIFRGTDTTALLTEWVMAELLLHRDIQSKIRREINDVVGAAGVPFDADVARMPYLQAVVKETLRAHPPGPLLSWARLATDDVQLKNGMVIPAGTTTMVNMWAITHDAGVWARPDEFLPERFLQDAGGEDVSVLGGNLRLAPFGAGRRVCPGKNLGLVTVGLWVARLVHAFEWAPAEGAPVDLGEVLKLSLEMKTPLLAVVAPVNAAGAL